MLYTAKNWKDDTIIPGIPWEFTPILSFSDKKDQQLQLNDPESEHMVFSGWEGSNPHSKVTASNPARIAKYLVVDYDSNIPSIDPLWIKNCGICLPQQLSRTIRGGVRLVYKLQEPVNVYSDQFAKNFLKQAMRHLKLAKLFPGFDERAFLQPALYYELGAEWREISDAEIPTSSTWGWCAKAGEYADTFAGVEIPFEFVAAEANRRWPGRWSGDWREGVRGVRFWDDSADNPTACVLRKTGCQTFTGSVAFLTWSQIFGSEFVTKFDHDRIKRVIEPFYHDGESYYIIRPTDDRIHKIARKDVELHLKTRCSVSPKVEKGESCSDLDKAEKLIQELKYIDGAAALVYRPPGLYTFQNKRILNTCRVEVMQPAAESSEYGEKFPWIAEFLDLMLPEPEQKWTFLAWLQRAYLGGLNKNPSQGQAMFIAGDANAGKTFLATHVLSTLLARGLHANPTLYLTGGSDFNEELYDSPLWCIDDATASSSEHERRKYTERLKQAVANREFMSYGKHKKPVSVEWMGRILVTCNDDSESVRILPELDMNNADKVIMLRANGKSGEFLNTVPKKQSCTDDQWRQQRVAEDLPHMAAFLRDWDPPEVALGSSRFGVKSYHHPYLVEKVREASPDQQATELICHWAESRQGWEEIDLNVTQLVADMQIDDGVRGILNSLKWGTVNLGRRLSALASKSDFPITRGRRSYHFVRQDILDWHLRNSEK